SDLKHLMLIGAYRDNEVNVAHPLRRKLDTIKSAGGKVAEITLAPLAREHLGQLIADALRCGSERAGPLAQLIHKKTDGNPFFAIQFMSSLADEGLLAFDHDAADWSWDFGRIHAKGYADNVADLMVGKLARLPDKAQMALQHFACLGNIADVTMLAIVLGTSEDEVHAALWEAVRLELVERLPGLYRFVHDRVQEAAYSLIPEKQRAAAHLRIGRLLVARTPRENREEAIFDIVNQLNRGAALITSRVEREQLAELNLLAGKRAKASSAYASALNYLIACAAQLQGDAWERRQELIFELELQRAECEFLVGELSAAAERLATLSTRTGTTVERAAVACLRIDVCTALNQSDRAVVVCLNYLQHVGIDWSPHPTREEVEEEYKRIWRQLGGRSIEELADLSLMTDTEWRATMDVLTGAASSAQHTDANLFCLIPCRMANLSLEHGNCDGSCFAYVWLGMILGPHFGEYEAAYRFGKLAVDLLEQRELRRFEARVYNGFGVLVSWTKHVDTGRRLLRRAFDVANKIGDLTYAGFSRNTLITVLLAAGDPLSDVQREAEAGLDFVRHARFGLVVDVITTQLQLIRTLRGLTPIFGFFDDAGFDEERFERHLEEDPRLTNAACWYWIHKLQARVHAEDYAAAIAAAANAEQLLWASPSFLELAEYHFYAALVRAALCDAVSAAERTQHLEALSTHHRQLQEWAANCQENFAGSAALVAAEIARIDRRDIDAMRLYQLAIRSARDNGFVHNEAIAYERASAFYRDRGFDEIADIYFRNARFGYFRWGAAGKVRQLDEKYPHLREEEARRAPARTIAAPVESLDLATVIKVSQAVSGEIVLEKLIDILMRTAIEQAGAERAVLVLSFGSEPRIAAEAATGDDGVVVQLRNELVTAAALPEPVLHYVLRTNESVILDDAAAQSAFAADAYIRERQARSILCLPLISEDRPNGVLYLENNLARGAFAPARTAVLKLLASQAATALENTYLYRDLAEREAKIRRLVEANIIGVFIGDFDGRIVEANDAFLRMVGYDREDLAAGRINWTDLTPRDWRERDAQWIEEHKRTGVRLPIEKEYFRKDGSRVPVLLGSATVEEGGNQSVAFVLDLTERKRAEAEARESERRYRETQMQLAHANRVATMGQLTASIAHEVNQPIAATVANAQAALRWLRGEPPNLDEVQQALGRIVRDGVRAGAVIDRIRTLIKKAQPVDERVEINAAIREVIDLTRGEATKNGVKVQTDLAEGLLLVRGDRVELQQVILNLILNALEAMSAMSEGSRELLIGAGITEEGDVLAAVRDSGPGLTPAILEHLFDAFYTTKPNGLGLGLSICRSIIEAHGGRLWASANAPRGAVFQFTLPTHPDNTTPQ
ncbi:MAG TPA: ATP-binding protein, partial [Roseiarcus sp.]|nr:ATP-binding protein [Roseiarcus sp.]